MSLTFSNISALLAIVIGLMVVIINLRVALNHVPHKWIYFVKASAGLFGTTSFVLALFRVAGSDSIPSWFGRPTFIWCLFALALGAIMSHKEGGKI